MFKAADNLIDEVLARIQLRHTQGEKPAECPGENETRAAVDRSPDTKRAGRLRNHVWLSNPALRHRTWMQPSSSTRSEWHHQHLWEAQGHRCPELDQGTRLQRCHRLPRCGAGQSEQRSHRCRRRNDEHDLRQCQRATVDPRSITRLATVVTGSNMIVAFESGLSVSRIGFESPKGAMSIVFGARG